MNALIVVDIQNDFLPGGSLAVNDGNKIIPLINKLMKRFDFVIATQDWHPAEHKSFASNHAGRHPCEVIKLGGLDQCLWPDHCIQNTHGAKFSADLDTGLLNAVFRKGRDIDIDSYSGFFDNGRLHSTGLYPYLKENGIDEVYIVGLAADYCVKFTATDAADLGLNTTVISDAVKAVNLEQGDYEKSMKEMREKGIKISVSTDLLK